MNENQRNEFVAAETVAMEIQLAEILTDVDNALKGEG